MPFRHIMPLASYAAAYAVRSPTLRRATGSSICCQLVVNNLYGYERVAKHIRASQRPAFRAPFFARA